MGTLQLSIHGLATTSSVPRKFNFSSRSSTTHLRFSTPKIRAVSTVPDSKSTAKDKEPDEPPAVDFAFVHVSLKVIVYANASSTWIYNLMGNFAVFFQSVLLPDGTPDVHFRRACGGQKLRDIMLDNNMELYGPYVSSYNYAISVHVYATVIVCRENMNLGSALIFRVDLC